VADRGRARAVRSDRCDRVRVHISGRPDHALDHPAGSGTNTGVHVRGRPVRRSSHSDAQSEEAGANRSCPASPREIQARVQEGDRVDHAAVPRRLPGSRELADRNLRQPVAGLREGREGSGPERCPRPHRGCRGRRGVPRDRAAPIGDQHDGPARSQGQAGHDPRERAIPGTRPADRRIIEHEVRQLGAILLPRVGGSWKIVSYDVRRSDERVDKLGAL